MHDGGTNGGTADKTTQKDVEPQGLVGIHWQPVGESNPSFQVENLAS
jgi:hypothetical protein